MRDAQPRNDLAISDLLRLLPAPTPASGSALALPGLLLAAVKQDNRACRRGRSGVDGRPTRCNVASCRSRICSRDGPKAFGPPSEQEGLLKLKRDLKNRDIPFLHTMVYLGQIERPLVPKGGSICIKKDVQCIKMDPFRYQKDPIGAEYVPFEAKRHTFVEGDMNISTGHLSSSCSIAPP